MVDLININHKSSSKLDKLTDYTNNFYQGFKIMLTENNL